MKDFELFRCCLGNGVTLCNKAVIENGDYKTIGHINTKGNIKLYVDESYISSEAMEIIKADAQNTRDEFLSRWKILSDINKYVVIINELPYRLINDIIYHSNKTLHEKVTDLEETYFNYY